MQDKSKPARSIYGYHDRNHIIIQGDVRAEGISYLGIDESTKNSRNNLEARP